MALFSWHCEKDDICDENTVTTPRLVVHFYDQANPTQSKNVSNLMVIGDGQADTLATFNSVSEILLPLRTTDDTTGYTLTLNSTSDVANADHLTFSYSRQNLYVSRACGYKTIFHLDDANPVVREDSGGDGLWIAQLNVEQPDVMNETDIDISIYY
jgi:hypothetical protein